MRHPISLLLTNFCPLRTLRPNLGMVFPKSLSFQWKSLHSFASLGLHPCIFLYRTAFYFHNWFALSPKLFVLLFRFVHLAISTTWRVSGVSVLNKGERGTSGFCREFSTCRIFR